MEGSSNISMTTGLGRVDSEISVIRPTSSAAQGFRNFSCSLVKQLIKVCTPVAAAALQFVYPLASLLCKAEICIAGPSFICTACIAPV